MSSLALMRWLESTPQRYDAGMRWLTLGRAASVQEQVAVWAVERSGSRVLEIGCGTGSLTQRLLKLGARVTALDSNPAMLELCRERLRSVPAARLELLECSAAEIDALPTAAFDSVATSFTLSEMGAAERGFVLREAAQRVPRGGVLALGDELRPRAFIPRVAARAVRGPQALLAWLLAGSQSRPLADLGDELNRSGCVVEVERRWLGGSLGAVRARRGAAGPAPP